MRRAQLVTHRRLNRRNTSGYTGVYPRGKRFAAMLKFDGVRHFLGLFDHPADAACVYVMTKEELRRDYCEELNAEKQVHA